MPFGYELNAKNMFWNRRFGKIGFNLNAYKDNLVMGFSYYKLLSSYTGYCVRVRRSSDSTEQDFGFVNNYIDYNAIVAFCGASSGYVSIWYNQYASGNNAIQSTNARQPKIVNSGSFLESGLEFNSSAGSVMPITKYDAINIIDPQLSIYTNFTPLSLTQTGFVFAINYDSGTTLQYSLLQRTIPSITFVIGALSVVVEATISLAVSKILFNWISTSANQLTANNGTTTTLGTMATSLTSYQHVNIGGRSNSIDNSAQSSYCYGNLKTICVFNANVDYSIISKV